MSSLSRRNLLSTVGLVLFALVAAGLSLAALTRTSASPIEATPITTTETTATLPPMETLPTEENSQPTATSQSTLGDSQLTGLTPVVVIGDIYSASDTPGIWLTSVQSELGWAPVTNLSTPGRGYIKKPQACAIDVCANFEGTIPAIVEAKPDLVITFGGTADGDRDLSDAAGKYYVALREALPEAELIAISPVTSEANPEYWLTMHPNTIRAAVEAVGGTFIDVGQPGVGDGEYLSTDAQSEIAATVIEELS